MNSKVVTCISVVIFLVLTAILFTPLQVFFGNAKEFTFTASDSIFVLLRLSFIVCIPLFTFLLVLRGKAYEKSVSFIGMLGVLLWWQGNIMVWDYGLFDGEVIKWNQKWYLGVLDAFVWIVLLFVALRKSALVFRYIASISLLFIVVQTVSVVHAYWAQVPEGKASEKKQAKEYLIDLNNRNKFVFSNEKNVILLVTDAFLSTTFQELLNENPDYKKDFEGFTYFRNALSVASWDTFFSVPVILTGQSYDNSQPIFDYIKDVYLSDTSLPKKLKENGFDVGLYPKSPKLLYIHPNVASNVTNASLGRISIPPEDLLELLDTAIFRSVPHYIKKHFFDSEMTGLSRMYAFFQMSGTKELSGKFTRESINRFRDIGIMEKMFLSTEVSATKPTFKYYHLWGLHKPLNMGANFIYKPMERTQENALKVARSVVAYLKLFFDHLKEKGIYDNSLIVIVGDHGKDLPISVNLEGEQLDIPPLIARTLPLFMAKPFNIRGKLKTSMAPVSLEDVSKTILSEIKVKIPDSMPGEDIFTLASNKKRKRYFYMPKDELRRDDGGFFPVWLLFRRPDRESGYCPPIGEFVLEGFSWQASSLDKPNRILYPKESNVAYFSRLIQQNAIVGNKDYFSAPVFYSHEKEIPVLTLLNDIPILSTRRFPYHEGAYVGVKLPINILTGKEYIVSLDVYDGFPYRAPDVIFQYVYIGETLVDRYDIGLHKKGWRQVTHKFISDSSKVDLRAEVRIEGDTNILPKGMTGKQHALDAAIGLKNLSIIPVNDR